MRYLCFPGSQFHKLAWGTGFSRFLRNSLNMIWISENLGSVLSPQTLLVQLFLDKLQGYIPICMGHSYSYIVSLNEMKDG